MGPSESTQAEISTPKVSRCIQTELEGFHKSSSAPEMPLAVPLVPTNSRGAGCPVQGHAKVDDAVAGDGRLNMDTNTSRNVKRASPSSVNVFFVVSPYGCGVCSRSFEEIDALVSHALSCPWPEPFQCSLCSELCMTWGATRDHLITHVNRGVAKCPLCERTFGEHWNKQAHVRGHIELHHVPIRPFVCNCCEGAFTTRSTIYTHSRDCRARTQVVDKYLGSSEKCDLQARAPLATTVFKCSVCLTAFLDRSVIARHMRVHLNQMQHSRTGEVAVPPAVMRCNAATRYNWSASCEMVASTLTQAKILTPKVSRCIQTESEGFHKSPPNPKVPLAGKVPLVPTSSRGARCAVQGHAEVDDAMAGDCELKMDANTSFDVETESPSFGNLCFVVSPYGCGVCSRSFEQVDALISHVVACQWPEPFRCGLCLELCMTWGATRDHLVTHVSRGTSKCPLCEHMFREHWTDLAHIKRHIELRHVPIRPFVCNCCEGAFTAKSDIHKHSRECRARMQVVDNYLGSSKKRDLQALGCLSTMVYKCSVCLTTFLDRSLIASHMRIHLNQMQHSRTGEGFKKHPFNSRNHRSDVA
ncbi:zinc finger protein 808 [Rhipicephalus sanguineus]|uniref:zinc finger protein 808 n=1 Tax=Rhipicephalus sanguineus TaxID=34632 RepID=UPI0020C5694D|nr:zinc finger protein 808 [Rhipicephalus sanguineus]